VTRYPGLLRIAPLQGETTSSLICRIASLYGMEAKVLRACWQWRNYPPEHEGGGARADAEVLLNAAGRRRQCSAYDELSEEQQQLLAGIGITTEVARAVRDHARTAPKRRTAALAADVEDTSGHAIGAVGSATLRGRRRAAVAKPERLRG
jgi:hypothetical protein